MVAMEILRSKFLWSNLLGMLLKGSHPRCVSCDELFLGTIRVQVLGLYSLVIFSLPLASHHATTILSCSLRMLKMAL